VASARGNVDANRQLERLPNRAMDIAGKSLR